MGAGELLSSFFSEEGAASSAMAAALGPIPAAWPVAAIATLLISDPADIWERGNDHGWVSDYLRNTVKSDITQAVAKYASENDWDGADKKTFMEKRINPALQALDSQAEKHDHAMSSHHLAAGVYQAAGVASSLIGSALIAQAMVVRASNVFPPAFVAAEGEANGFAAAMSRVIQTILEGLKTMGASLKTIFEAAGSSFKRFAMVWGGLSGAGAMGLQAIAPKPDDKVVKWPTMA